MIIPRHKWLQDRVETLIDAIQDAKRCGDMGEYLRILCELAAELTYMSTEWAKCYPKDEGEERRRGRDEDKNGERV